MTRTAQQTKRLWELVDLMKFDPDPEKFTMRLFRWACDTPACLFGHAEVRWQRLKNIGYSDPASMRFFGLDEIEFEYLFSFTMGDRTADTPAIAASRVIDVIYGGQP